MTTAAEYREFAQECTRWAAEEESEEMRATFLVMAKQWMEAALRVEGVVTQDVTARDGQSLITPLRTAC